MRSGGSGGRNSRAMCTHCRVNAKVQGGAKAMKDLVPEEMEFTVKLEWVCVCVCVLMIEKNPQ